MGGEADANYTEKDFLEALNLIVANAGKKAEINPVAHSRTVLLGGQSGAGKTTLHKVFIERFGKNAVIINGDSYRSLHPLYREFDRKYGPESVNHTAAWAGRMTEAVIDALSDMGYNLIIEGTLRTAEVPTKTATLLRERGYAVSLALMAVKPEISLISCQIRLRGDAHCGNPFHGRRIRPITTRSSTISWGIWRCSRSRGCSTRFSF